MHVSQVSVEGESLCVGIGTDWMFSYGHHTITVPLPQSMSALREVSHTPTGDDDAGVIADGVKHCPNLQTLNLIHW